MRLLGLEFGTRAQLLVVSSCGIIAGCAAVLLWPSDATRARVAAKVGPSTAGVDPSSRLGELLISAPSFGSGVEVTLPSTTIPGVVTGPASDIRLLGVARARGRGRALVVSGQADPVWINVGACAADICVTGIGRSSADLKLGGEVRKIELFRQRMVPGAALPPVASAAPAPAQVTSPPATVEATAGSAATPTAAPREPVAETASAPR